MIALLRTEWAKTLRRPRTYIAIGLVMLIPVIIAFALWANPPDPGGGGDGGGAFFYVASQTGLLFPAAMLRVISRLVLLVVIALFAGDAIAGEASTGNLRYQLLRPIRRGRLLAAKLIDRGVARVDHDHRVDADRDDRRRDRVRVRSAPGSRPSSSTSRPATC